MSFVRTSAIIVLGLTITAGHSKAAILTQLANFGQFNGAISAFNNFESQVNVPGITFDATAQRGDAASWCNGVTPSGQWGLVEDVLNEPLRATLSTDAYEVGMFFGNDDFGYFFNVTLEVFDASNNSLGSVAVAANRNDNADQFIGLRSDTAFRYVNISYQRPQAQQLWIYIDDFGRSSYVVPEPGSSLLLVVGLGTLVVWRRRPSN